MSRTGGNNPREIAYPSKLVGTDSHTTMVNCVFVQGWGGVGVSRPIPKVFGFELPVR